MVKPSYHIYDSPHQGIDGVEGFSVRSRELGIQNLATFFLHSSNRLIEHGAVIGAANDLYHI